MKLLLISDLHGDIEKIKAISAELSAADLILFAGDFAKFGAPETAEPAFDALSPYFGSLLAVSGNCDPADFRKKFAASPVCVENSCVFRDGLCIGGAGGALKFTGDTPFERDDGEILSALAPISQAAGEGPLSNAILIVHQPPKDSGLDKISSGAFVGSQKVADFVKKFQPLMILSGHIHEAQCATLIGETVAINPGALFEGNFMSCDCAKECGKWKISNIKTHKI